VTDRQQKWLQEAGKANTDFAKTLFTLLAQPNEQEKKELKKNDTAS
jgi:hypothetical protein